MKKRNKRLIVLGILLAFSIVILILGLKYFPFTKVVKMPAGSEREFTNPEKTGDRSPHTLYYDFEIAPGKETPGGFYKGLAHSGQYAVKAFGQNSFSVAVERTAGEIGVENLKAVAISAWIYVFPTSKEVKGNLVFTASNEVGVNVCWEAAWIVEPEVPRGKWFKVSKYFDLSAVNFKPDYKIQVYFWNNSSTDILVDDYFIAFGGPVDRRGDSARVDMTRPGGFMPKFNFPPFPVAFLERESLERSIGPSDIDPADFAVAGDFLNAGNDGLLVVKKNGSPALFAYCRDVREFRKIMLNNIAAITAVAPVIKVLNGKFIPSPGDQFMVIGEKGRVLCAVTPPENTCSQSVDLKAAVQVLWRTDTRPVPAFAGDFNGDRRTEILELSQKGSWKVLSFEQEGKNGGGAWASVVRDTGMPLGEWNSDLYLAGLSAGRFLPDVSHDVVLTVTRAKSDGKLAYSLRQLNPSGKTWEPLIREIPGHSPATTGLDTLKPGDQFFGGSGTGNKMSIFRYNRDWRYDLKELRFNDSTFAIWSSVDFEGYDGDRNPKYYESLKLIPGHFLDPSSVSLVVVGHVAASRNYQSVLPDFVNLYSLPGKE